jgi:hypothetical protein
VSLLTCQLSKGVVSDKKDGGVDSEIGTVHSGSDEHEEIREFLNGQN